MATILALLTKIPLRWWLYIGAAAALGFVLWHDHHQTQRANRLAAENVTLEATVANLHKIRAIEQADRRHADETAQALAADLARIRSEPRITGVRICAAPRPVSAEGRGAAGVETAAAGRLEGETAPDPDAAGIDVSDAVDAYASDCAMVGAIAKRWQEFDASRTH